MGMFTPTGGMSMAKIINQFVKQKMSEMIAIDIGYVESVNTNGIESTDYMITVNVPDKNLSLENVPVLTNYVDDDAGHMVVPKIGQLCIVGFLSGQTEDVVCLGFIRRTYSAEIVDKVTGKISLSAVKEAMQTGVADTNYKIRTVGRDIIFECKDGSKIRLNDDGSFKLFNKDNYGIEVDASGNMTLRGVSINATQSPGSW